MMRWVQWYQDQPHTTAPYGPHSNLLWPPFRTPIQNPCTGAPFKREPSVIGKWARHQNNQDISMSSMVSRSALYNSPIWPPFKPLMTPFKTPFQNPHSGSPFKTPIQNPHSGSLFKGDSFPIQCHKIHQSGSAQQAEENASFETSWAQLTVQPMAQQTICSEFMSTGRSWSSRHEKCPRTMNMISSKKIV